MSFNEIHPPLPHMPDLPPVPPNKRKTLSFSLEIELGGDLTMEDIWPDRDAPENPTMEDLMTLVKKEGSVSRLINEWCLDDSAEVTVCRYYEDPDAQHGYGVEVLHLDEYFRDRFAKHEPKIARDA